MKFEIFMWFSKKVFTKDLAKIVGFDIVEIAPREIDLITEFTMAKLTRVKLIQ
jgi:arginase family enzyme